MNYLTSIRALAIAGVVFAAPATGLSKDKHHHGSSHGHKHHGHSYHGHSSHRHAYHGHSYRSPYYGHRPHYYSRPSISLGFYSSPSYYRSPYYGSPYYGSSYYGSSYYGSYPTRTYSTRTVYVPRTSYSAGYSDDLAVDVQRALARRGYYRGGIDGDVGPGTRSAIRSYQYERGLTVTGRIDGSLLRSLGLS